MDKAQSKAHAALTDSHWWWVARIKVLRRLLSRFLGKDSKRKILEVGCSTGANLRMLQDFGTVHAMDLDAPSVEYCRMRFPGIRIYDGGIPDPLRDSYDVICLFDVLEQIEDEDGALEWIDDHLAANGVLLVTVPAYDFLGAPGDGAFRRYTKPALEALLRRRFDVAYSSYFNTHLFPAIAMVRLVQRLLHLDGGAQEKAAAGGGAVTNRVLQAIFASERVWLPAFRLPFGVSIFAVAGKAKAA
jgi:SAM-dependent methyltransferase